MLKKNSFVSFGTHSHTLVKMCLNLERLYWPSPLCNALTWVLGHKLKARVMTLVTLKKIFQMIYQAFQWKVIWSFKLSFMKLGVILIVWLLTFHMFITIFTYFHFLNLISLYDHIFQDPSNGQKWVNLDKVSSQNLD